MRNFILLFCLLGQLSAVSQTGQDTVLVLTLEHAVEIARRQSPDAWVARHNFRSQYWNYCYYKANYLPSLTFTSSPDFDNSINVVTLEDGTSRYVQQNQTSANATLSLTQNIALTGGQLSLRTSLSRMDMLSKNTHSYRTNPVSITYSQVLFGYNSLKWDKMIEPIRFEEAKKSYVTTLEYVSENATRLFFGLARAQTNMEMAKFNYVQADTLYIFAQGRYELGTITDNEKLQLELNRLTEENNMLNAQIEVDDYMEALRAYLGIQDAVPIIVNVRDEVPQFTVDPSEALQLAIASHPDILTINRRILESESNVARVKASVGMTANIFAQLGLTKANEDIIDAYRNLSNQQYVQVGIRLPILDWGRSKGLVRVEQSRRDMVVSQQEQNRNNFEQNVLKAVKQFNFQAGKVAINAKTDHIAERRGEIARRLYLLGESTILDLNASIKEKDAAKRDRINSLSTYWTLYYQIRRLTLFDFHKGLALTEDYEALIK